MVAHAPCEVVEELGGDETELSGIRVEGLEARGSGRPGLRVPPLRITTDRSAPVVRHKRVGLLQPAFHLERAFGWESFEELARERLVPRNRQDAGAMQHVLGPLPIIGASICETAEALSLAFPFLPRSNVFASVVPDVPSLAMELPVCELSLVFRLALPPRHDTLSVKFQSAQITDILEAVAISHRAIARKASLMEDARDGSTIQPGHSALSVPCSVLPLALEGQITPLLSLCVVLARRNTIFLFVFFLFPTCFIAIFLFLLFRACLHVFPLSFRFRTGFNICFPLLTSLISIHVIAPRVEFPKVCIFAAILRFCQQINNDDVFGRQIVCCPLSIASSKINHVILDFRLLGLSRFAVRRVRFFCWSRRMHHRDGWVLL
mmetsp:Transcript_33380/g.79556  ORF Transcript_33380/g.79556 Transcript_33380/m.79556 type:complete len:378 (+) Transcript_33380:1834-2967(+)